MWTLISDRSEFVAEVVTPPPVGWKSFYMNAAAVSRGHLSFQSKKQKQKITEQGQL